MNQVKNLIIKVFNQGSIISISLFSLGAVYLAWIIPSFSLTRFTISQLYIFASSGQQLALSLLFLTKFILDIAFSFSVFRKLSVSPISPPGILWLIPVISFGLLGLFPCINYPQFHFFISVVMFISWMLTEHEFAHLSQNADFFAFTKKYILFQVLLALLFIAGGTINGVFEISYLIISLIWIWNFLLVLDLR